VEPQRSSGPDLYSSVTIMGEVEHGLVTAAMGVQPSHTARRGQPTRPGGPPSKQTIWLWRMDAVQSYDATPSLQAVADWLQQRAAAVSSLRLEHDLRIVVALVAYIDPKHHTVPSVYIEHGLLQQLGALEVEVELDFSLLADDAGSVTDGQSR
jgi:hypothetical protein